MHKIAFQKPMTRAYEPCTPLEWRAQTWRVRLAVQSKPIASRHREDFMKRTWTLLAITLLGLCGCWRTSANEPEGKLFVSGRIDGDTVDISSKRPGRICQITVREGDSVIAGQLLAMISSPQDEARYDAQKARISSDKHKMEELQRQLATYGEKIRQAEIVHEQSQKNAPAQVKQAEANLATAKAELVRAQAELEQSKIDAQRYPPLAEMGA